MEVVFCPLKGLVQMEQEHNFGLLLQQLERTKGQGGAVEVRTDDLIH